MSDELEAMIQCAIGEKLSSEEIQNLVSKLKLAQATLATGELSTALGGNASNSLFISGNNNTVINITKEISESSQKAISLDIQVYSAVASFRSDFEVTCEQIKHLEYYKGLHDVLYKLEFQCYDSINRELRRFPDDEIAIDMLKESLWQLEELVKELTKITTQQILPTIDCSWVQELEQAKGSLQQAIKHLAVESLKLSINLIKEIVNDIPSQLIIRLNSAARSLRINSLTEKTTYILTNANELNLNTDQFDYSNFLIELDKIYTSISELVKQHDQWHSLDLKLRKTERILVKQDFLYFKTYWLHLLTEINFHYSSYNNDYIIDLRTNYKKLEDAILVEDKASIEPLLKKCRRQVCNHLHTLNNELWKSCNTLRTVGEPLSVILGMIL